MKLTRLKVHRYRDVAPGAELAFSPSFNLVLGQNGTGRTTLLELISTVLGADFSGLVHEELSLEYDLAFPGVALHVSVRNEERSAARTPEGAARGKRALLPLRSPDAATPGLVPSVEMVLLLEAPATRLVLRADASGMDCEVDGRPAYSQGMDWSLLGRSLWVVLFIAAQHLERELKGRLKELLRRTFLLSPSRFDEALGTFEHIGDIRYGMEVRGSEVFPLGLMALPAWMPGWLRARVEGGAPADVLELQHDDVPHGFLAKFVTLAGLAGGTLRVELLGKRSFEGGGRLELGRFGFRFTRRDGSALPQEQLGHGQKRLLSFLYYLDVNEDFAIADELASGLHPRWIEACVRELGERQAFLTSQNPLLFEYAPLWSTTGARAALILCAVELRDGRERRVWAHPAAEVAERLAGACRARAGSTGELLRAHGLW